MISYSKILFSVSASLIIAGSSFAQSKQFLKAETEFNAKNYSEALELYKEAAAKGYSKKEKSIAVLHEAECYRMLADVKKLESAFLKAKNANPKDAYVAYQYAEALRVNGKSAEAKKAYEDCLTLDPNFTLAKNGLESLKVGDELAKKTSKYTIKNLEKANSKDDDFAARYSNTDATQIVFTSNRKGTTGDNKDNGTGKMFSDLFTSSNEKGAWKEASTIDGSINGKFNDGAPTYNADFTEMFFTRCPQERKKDANCSILSASKAGDKWSDAASLNLFDGNASVGQPCLSSDGKLLFYSSNSKDGKGGYDIWYSKREGGNWSAPINCGPTVNTTGDERFPYFGADNKLYFSSNGLPGIGGWDIFSSSLNGSSFSKSENLGAPFNSNADDFAISFTNKNKRGLLSSNRSGGKGGDDIYEFTLPEAIFTLKTIVKNAKTGEVLANTKIELKGTDGTTVDCITDKDGACSFKLKQNTGYNILASKDEFFNAKDKATTVGLEESKDLLAELKLDPIEKNKPIKLPVINYELDKADLTAMAVDSLQDLLTTLNENPKLVIELMSHTDCRATKAYNQKLSQARATSVVEWLKKQGVNAARLSAKGYGETQLLNDCACEGAKKSECSEEEHAANRRTEFKVLRTDFDAAKENK